MPKISKNALVPYSAKQMYDLVNDVNAYQHFLPGCKLSEVIAQSEDKMLAKMVLAKGGIEQVLLTENTLTDARSIEMQLHDGPFKRLQGGWTFSPMSDEACRIALDLEFSFSSKLIDMAFGKIFKTLTNNMVKAFSERAKEVYKS
jgi:ribosome-associated toxin RatA of RatAB toxin-antitoxin module